MNPIKHICEIKGITQKELSKRTGISEARISRLANMDDYEQYEKCVKLNEHNLLEKELLR